MNCIKFKQICVGPTIVVQSILNGFHSAAYGDSHNGYYVGNTPGVKRLGIPSFNMQDASQGFRTVDATKRARRSEMFRNG